MSYYDKHVFFCCNQRDGGARLLQRQGRVADARLRQGPRQGARPRRARARCASTRPAASTAARKARASWSIRTRSGTPTSTRPTSTRSSRSTCRTAASSSACGCDAGEHAARARRRARRAASNAPSTSPSGAARGVALIAHPHPLFGGTLDNKVVQTLARAFFELGYVAWRPNFRGVGADRGRARRGPRRARGPAPSLEHIRHGQVRPGRLLLRRVVQTQLAQSRQRRNGWCSSASAVTRHRWRRRCRADTLVIHGEHDDTVPLAAVLDWARPQELPVVVVPGADHFFHRKLHILRAIVAAELEMSALVGARAAQVATAAPKWSAASTSRSRRASASACSGRTAPARPPRSGSASGLIEPDAGEIELLGEPVPQPRARGARAGRRRAAVRQPRSRLHRRREPARLRPLLRHCRRARSGRASRRCSSSPASPGASDAKIRRSPAA